VAGNNPMPGTVTYGEKTYNVSGATSTVAPLPTVTPTAPPTEIPTVTPTATPSGPVAASGQCGDAVYWNLNESGLMKITGTGEMWDFLNMDGVGDAELPWESYKANIKSVIFDEGVTSVGTKINVEHLSADPVGIEVSCESELVEIDNRKLCFNIVAMDKHGVIGKAYHERFLIKSQSFMEKTTAKL
jgi:hypothetical protein